MISAPISVTIPRAFQLFELTRRDPNAAQLNLAVVGFVVKRRRRKPWTYWDITDGASQLQIAACEDQALPAPTIPYEGSEKIKEGCFYEFVGVLRSWSVTDHVTKENKSTIATIQLSAYREVDPANVTGSPVPVLASTTQRFHLADMNAEICRRLARMGFREYMPEYIQTSIPSPTLDPLSVLFDGRGAPLHLATSPLPQLVRASTLHAFLPVFCSARMFCRASRDGLTSAESPIVSGLYWLEDAVTGEWLTWAKRELPKLFEPTEPDKTDNSIREAGPEVRVPRISDASFGSRAVGAFQLSGHQSVSYSVTSYFSFAVKNSPPLVDGLHGKLGDRRDFVYFVMHLERFAQELVYSDYWAIPGIRMRKLRTRV